MFALPITDGSFGLLPPLLLLSICLFVCLCKQINLCRLKHFGLPGVHSVLSSSPFCAPSASIVMLMTSDELLICCLCPAPECCAACTALLCLSLSAAVFAFRHLAVPLSVSVCSGAVAFVASYALIELLNAERCCRQPVKPHRQHHSSSSPFSLFALRR